MPLLIDRVRHLSDGQKGRCYGYEHHSNRDGRDRGGGPIPRFGPEQRDANAESGKTEAMTEHAGTATPNDSFNECGRRFPEEA